MMEAADSVTNEIQEGEASVVVAQRDSSPNFSTTESVHPLKQMLILSQVFEHLDTHGLITCRRVCSKWNDFINLLPNTEIPIIISERNIKRFNILMKSPQAEMCCRNVTLDSDLDLTTCSPTIFLETNGLEITTLEVKSTMNYLPFFYLPKNCPNLVKLDIQPDFYSSDFEIPNSLEPTWENPFPYLKSLTIRLFNRSVLFPFFHPPLLLDQRTNIITRFLILVLRKALGLAHLSLIRWDSFLYQNVASELKLQQAEAFHQRIKQVHVDFAYTLDSNHLKSLWMTPELRLTSLELNSISPEMTTLSFSTLLKSLAPTLEELKMECDTSDLPDDFVLHFPCQMKSLKCLENNCYRETDPIMPLVCSAAKNGNPCNLFENLLALRIFAQIIPISKGTCEIGGKHFWDAIFPVESDQNGFVEKALCVVSTLIVPTYLIKELARSFPHLKALFIGLEKESSMMEVVTLLNNLKIEVLTVFYYYSTTEGFDEFSSAITGISLNDCRNYEEIVKSGKEISKTHNSLSDWTDLREFYLISVREDITNALERQVLSYVSVHEGFAKMKQLRSLEITGFNIHSRHVTTILDSIPLKTLKLELSSVTFVDSGEQVDVTDIHALRNKYPNVEFINTETEDNEDI